MRCYLWLGVGQLDILVTHLCYSDLLVLHPTATHVNVTLPGGDIDNNAVDVDGAYLVPVSVSMPTVDVERVTWLAKDVASPLFFDRDG